MKKNRIELDVDVIGNQKDSLTKEEEKMISNYIQSHRLKRNKKVSIKKVSA